MKSLRERERENGSAEVDKKWRKFKIQEYFTLRSTNSGIDKNKLINTNREEVPYITRTDKNNGISMKVAREQQDKFQIEHGNVITIGLDTQTMFYQKDDFHTGQNIHILSYDEMNEYNALFVISCFKRVLEALFFWGSNGATLGRLQKMSITLPATDEGKPDWKYMTNFMKIIIDRERKRLNIFHEDFIFPHNRVLTNILFYQA